MAKVTVEGLSEIGMSFERLAEMPESVIEIGRASCRERV